MLFLSDDDDGEDDSSDGADGAMDGTTKTIKNNPPGTDGKNVQNRIFLNNFVSKSGGGEKGDHAHAKVRSIAKRSDSTSTHVPKD